MPQVFTKARHPHQSVDVHLGSDSRNPNPVHTLLEWKAASRPYRKKGSSYYRTITIIIGLLIFITLLLGQFLLIGVLLALGFVVYVLGFVPPEDITYRVSTQGITIGDHFYFWQDLNSFWFTYKDGFKILHILTRLRFPGELMILIGDLSEERVKEVVAEYLPFHEVVPTSFIQHWSEKLESMFPLETQK